MNMPRLVGSVARALAVRACNHADLFAAYGTVIRTVARAYRTAHYTSVSLRTDHIIQATNPQKMASMTEKMSLSMIDMIVQQSEHIANNPAKIVSMTQPAKPRTFKKVLDTIESIITVYFNYWQREAVSPA